MAELEELRTGGCVFEGSFQRGNATRIEGTFYYNSSGFGVQTTSEANADIFIRWEDVDDIRGAALDGGRGLVVRKKSPFKEVANAEMHEIGITNIAEALQFLRLWDFYRSNKRLPTQEEAKNLRSETFKQESWWSCCMAAPAGCAFTVIGGVTFAGTLIGATTRLLGLLPG